MTSAGQPGSHKQARDTLHPLLHLVFGLAVSTVVFALSEPAKLLSITLLAFSYAGWRCEGGFRSVLKTLYHSLPLLLSLAIIQILFRRQGALLWGWKGISIHSIGAQMALLLCLRLIAVIFCAKALAELGFSRFSAAFATLRLPEEFSFMLAYAVQLAPGFIRQLKGFMTSLKLRGISPARLPLGDRLQIYNLLSTATLSGIIRNSEAAAIALEMRGFRSAGKRSSLHQIRFRITDALVLAGIILAASATILL